jgi:hypothetical protein
MPLKCGKSAGNVFIVLLYIAIGSVYYTFIHLYDPCSSPSTNSWVILILFHALLVLQQLLYSLLFSQILVKSQSTGASVWEMLKQSEGGTV